MASRQRFDALLEEVRQSLIAMGATCEVMLRDAITALTEQNLPLIDTVLHSDDEVDRLEQQVEEAAIYLLAIQQPVVARDLRFVSMALKAGGKIERIGDHCLNIAKTARRMTADKVIFQPVVDIPRFGNVASMMLHDMVNALVRSDAALARRVIAMDDEADVLYQEMQRELRQQILADGREKGVDALRASYLLFVAHYLERICDYCVGISEWVIYAETGDPISAAYGGNADPESSEDYENEKEKMPV
jgi:phosphate transport system protein